MFVLFLWTLPANGVLLGSNATRERVNINITADNLINDFLSGVIKSYHLGRKH